MESRPLGLSRDTANLISLINNNEQRAIELPLPALFPAVNMAHHPSFAPERRPQQPEIVPLKLVEGMLDDEVHALAESHIRIQRLSDLPIRNAREPVLLEVRGEVEAHSALSRRA